MKNQPRYLMAVVAVLLGLPPLALGSSVPKDQISADAKWVIHADLTAFRASQVGQYVQTNFLNAILQQMKTNLKFDVEALVQKLTSVTAYGSEFQKDPQANLTTGVLLIKTDAEGQKIVQGLVAAQQLAEGEQQMIKEVQQEPYPLYVLGKDLFGAFQPGHIIALGKSRERIEQAHNVLKGRTANLTKSENFSEFPAVPNAFFFLAVAEGFNSKELAPLPQAKVLQMADGAQIVLGEKTERIFADLALKTKTTEVVGQIKQVLEGIVALFSLGQPEDKDLADLVKGTKVTAANKVVSVGIEFPIARALARLNEENTSQPPKKPKKKKSKPVADAKTEVGEETPQTPKSLP